MTAFDPRTVIEDVVFHLEQRLANGEKLDNNEQSLLMRSKLTLEEIERNKRTHMIHRGYSKIHSCYHCGIEFISHNVNIKYCSVGCREDAYIIRAYRLKQAAKIETYKQRHEYDKPKPKSDFPEMPEFLKR